MKAMLMLFLMYLSLVSCRQSEKGKEEQLYKASETGTEKASEGEVSDGPAGMATANSDTIQQDTLNDATRKFPSPSKRNEVTPPEVTKPN